MIIFTYIKKKIYIIYKLYFNFLFYISKLKNKRYNYELNLIDIKNSYSSLNEVHKYFHHYFHNISPLWLRQHRKYFSKNKRSFGEDAFHAMWYKIFKEFKPNSILEIGVYRGSTISLFKLLSQHFYINSEIHGISPFSSAGDKVSKYLDNLDYYNDVLFNFNYFNLELPILHKGFSNDILMIDFINSKTWDLIYIDGNHDYEVVKSDFEVCSKCLNIGGLLVLDDASLFTTYKAPFYSSKGHPGPSKVASEINLDIFEEILSVGHNRVFKKIKI
jgi:hypothetical protein